MHKRELEAIHRKITNALAAQLDVSTALTSSTNTTTVMRVCANTIRAYALTSIITDVESSRDLLISGEMETWEALSLAAT